MYSKAISSLTLALLQLLSTDSSPKPAGRFQAYTGRCNLKPFQSHRIRTLLGEGGTHMAFAQCDMASKAGIHEVRPNHERSSQDASSISAPIKCAVLCQCS